MMLSHSCTFGRPGGRSNFRLNLTDFDICKGDQQPVLAVVSSIRRQLHGADTKGRVLITTADAEFCPGFDSWNSHGAAVSGSGEAHKDRFLDMINLFKPVVADLISLPMPTIATLNGPSTVAGLLLSLSHDYLIMKPGVTSLLSDESSADLSLPPFFESLIRSKAFGNIFPPRNLVARDLQFTDEEAAKIGFLNIKEEVKTDTVESAEQLANYLARKNWNGQVYSELRKALHPELCKELGLTCETILPKLGM